MGREVRATVRPVHLLYEAQWSTTSASSRKCYNYFAMFHFVDCDSVQTFDVPDSNQVNIMCKALVQLQRLLGNLTFKIVSVARKIMLSLHIEVIFN